MAGTTAIHLIILVAGDAYVVFHPLVPHEVAPHVELVDVEVPAVVTPPPPPVAPLPEVHDEPKPVVATPTPAAHRASAPQQIREPQPVHAEQPAVAGGEQVVKEEDIAPAATGVAVAPGTPHDRIGRGGTGGDLGAGSGGGSADAPVPVSVATIKTLAKPRGDYGYLGGDNYPAEARRLGIEGVIKVKLIVDAAGKVTRKVLLTRLGHGLDELALDQAAKIEFDPARDTDDHAVASVVVWTFNMTLPK